MVMYNVQCTAAWQPSTAALYSSFAPGKVAPCSSPPFARKGAAALLFASALVLFPSCTHKTKKRVQAAVTQGRAA